MSGALFFFLLYRNSVIYSMTGQEKFDTCMYRSKEKHYVQETWCCGSKREEGYLCIRKLIDNVTPTICSDCIFYQQNTNGENKEIK